MWLGSKFQLTKLRRVTLPIPRTSAHLSKHFEFPGLLDKNWINQLFNSQGIKFFRIDSEASEKLSTCPGSWTSNNQLKTIAAWRPFFKIRTHALCPENPLRARSCHWPLFGDTNFDAHNVGPDFPTFWSNHKFSFIAHLHFREICKPIWASRARLHLTATNFDAWIFEGLSSQSSRHKFWRDLLGVWFVNFVAVTNFDDFASSFEFRKFGQFGSFSFVYRVCDSTTDLARSQIFHCSTIGALGLGFREISVFNFFTV
jgi:hypothetical protein